MPQTQPDITVIIVNYKVKEYIANLLNSIDKAESGFQLQIIVVDNDSGDDSVTFLKDRFPEVEYIENDTNLGFGKANNQAIRKAQGKYTLIINPDTLVSEDTFSVLVDHMNNNPQCGAAGCKILNPDGTFAPESRRSVPTIWTAFSKVMGLNFLFPKSKLFGQYYLSWLEEDEPSRVPVLSGSFMFWRTEVLNKLKGFDEIFFMYGEDIDICYRVQETGFHIDYVPDTSIIHYKGESTKKGNLKYIKIFNNALFLFFEKHHSYKYSFFFKVFIYISIWLKTFISFALTNLKSIGSIASDLVLLNISVILGFLIRFKFSYEIFSNIQNLKFLWINLLASIIYVFVGGMLDLFRSKKDSISNHLKAIVASYTGVAVITFFVRDYAFSRLALIFGLAIALVLMLAFKLIQINRLSGKSKVTGRLKRTKIFVVGDEDETSEIKTKIHSRPDWNYEVVGTVAVRENHEGAIGTTSQLQDLLNAYEVDQVFFVLKSISYKEMLLQISILQANKVVFKLIPDSMDFILGKSNVEYLESIPLVEVGLAYSKGINQFLKRTMDIFISLPLWLCLFIFLLPLRLFTKTGKVEVNGFRFYENPIKNKWKNRLLLFEYVLAGKLSLVGTPINYREKEESSIKHGLTGLVQINASRIASSEEQENHTLYYLQNYSIWLDIDILIKTFFNRISTLHELQDALKEAN
ncbi:MAG: glycosyltransferase [Balneolaceae bacterium]